VGVGVDQGPRMDTPILEFLRSTLYIPIKEPEYIHIYIRTVNPFSLSDP
jgi:hypothetical protein